MTEPDGITITPDQIDDGFVPTPDPAVEQAVVGGDLVLVDGWRSASVVGPLGSVIWGSFDGRCTVGQIVADLAGATGADPEVVAHDVLGFARQMGAQGYLVGVRPPTPDDLDLSVAVVPGLAVGEVVDDTEVRVLGDADGDSGAGAGEVGALADLRGGPVLLVNWSPYCGYCSAVADLLAVLVEPLERAGISLVLLAVGDDDANRAVVDAAGFGGRVLLRTGEVDPFRAYGTPSAYHLDEEGRLVAPMAGGAEAVLALATELAGVDPYPLLPGEGSDPVPPGTRYLLTDGACGPLSGDEPRVRWSGIRAYRIGEHHVGIRHDTEATAAVLDRLFPGRRVRDRRAGHSYAVALQLPDGTDPVAGRGEPGPVGVDVAEPEPESADTGAPDPRRAAATDLRLLVAGGVPLVRSRYPSRVLRALLWRLADDTLGYATEPGHLRVQATAALVDGRAVLLPAQINVFGPSMQARLARAGFHVADPPFPEIDLATAEVVVPVPAVDHDPTVLDGLDPQVVTGSELPPVEPGRYPLVGWAVLHPSERAVTRFSPAEAAAATLSLVYETEDAPRRLVELGELFARIRGVGLWYASEAGLVDAAGRALGDGPDAEDLVPW